MAVRDLLFTIQILTQRILICYYRLKLILAFSVSAECFRYLCNWARLVPFNGNVNFSVAIDANEESISEEQLSGMVLSICASSLTARAVWKRGHRCRAFCEIAPVSFNQGFKSS